MNRGQRLLVAAIICVAGCNSTNPPESGRGSPTEGQKPRIALVMKSLANEFFSTMAKGAETHQKQHADEYELIVNGINDERDLSRQVALVDEMVASGVEAIVIAPADSKALVPALRKAQKAGVAVVNIDNRLDTDVLKEEGIAIPFVGPDNQAGAQKVAFELTERLDAGDSVLILEGIRTSFNAQQRLNGFQTALEQAGVKIADSQSAEWEMAKANTIAASMLSEHPEAKAILAANDSMALGAIAAVKSAGRTGDVLVVGFDNITAVQQAIRDGKVLATADQHGDQLAVYGIEAALEMIENPALEPADIETPVDLVTAESLSQ